MMQDHRIVKVIMTLRPEGKRYMCNKLLQEFNKENRYNDGLRLVTICQAHMEL